MIIGKNTLAGTPASASATTNKLLYGTGQEAVLSANQKLIAAYIGWGGKSVNPTGTPTGEIGLYDVSGSNYTTAPKIFSVAYSFSNAALSGSQWIYIPLDVDMSAHAGKTLAPAFAGPSTGNAFDVIIETLSGANRKNGGSASTTLESTLAAGSVVANTAWAVYFETEDIAPATTINTINGSSFGAVKAGSTGNTVTTTSSFTPASGTHGGKAISAIAGSAGSYTFTSAAYVDGATFPEPDTAQTFTLTDGTTTPTASSVYSSPDGMSSVVIVNPETIDNTYLTEAIAGITNPDRIVFPTEGGDFSIAADGKITCASAGARVLWWWKSSTQVMTQLNVTVNEAGGVVSASRGLTSAGLTSSGLTNAGQTSSGL